MKKSRVKKQGRIKKIVSDWEHFWDNHTNVPIMKSLWSNSRIELLHIAVALLEFTPEHIIGSLKIIKARLAHYNVDWTGNLSSIFQILKDDPNAINAFNDTVLGRSITCLVVTYGKFFGYTENNDKANNIVYHAYHNTRDRHSNVSILCKAIISRFLLNNDGAGQPIPDISANKEIDQHTKSTITSIFLCAIQMHNVVNESFAEEIWFYNYYYLPFMREPSYLEKAEEAFEKSRLNDFKQKLVSYFDTFKKIDLLSFFHLKVAEVIMGFIARQQYLFEKVIEQEERHEGEIAESTLRLLYENRLKLLWLLHKQDVNAIQQFRDYRVGRENLVLEELNKELDQSDEAQNVRNALKKQLSTAMREEGIENYEVGVEKGDAFEKSIRGMAEDIGSKEIKRYNVIYKRLSDIIHGNWRILEKYHLERSLNPAHDGMLRYSSENSKYAGLLPSHIALQLSVDTLIEFFDIFELIKAESEKLNSQLIEFKAEIWEAYKIEFLQ